MKLRKIIGIAAAATLGFGGVTATTLVPAGPAYASQCPGGTSYEHLISDFGTFDWFNDPADQWWNADTGSPTKYCALYNAAGTHAQFRQAGTDSCFTYSGDRSGNGDIVKIGCSPNDSKASQDWTYEITSNGTFVMNGYLGTGYCIDGPFVASRLIMNPCAGSPSQEWFIVSG